MAKLIIKLANAVAEVINHDPQINGAWRVVFMPDFNVKRAQLTMTDSGELNQVNSTDLRE